MRSEAYLYIFNESCLSDRLYSALLCQITTSRPASIHKPMNSKDIGKQGHSVYDSIHRTALSICYIGIYLLYIIEEFQGKIISSIGYPYPLFTMLIQSLIITTLEL